MSEERPLTEFSSADAVDDHAGGGNDGDAEPTEPATVTYRWCPDGSVCAQCGESTGKQWRDDGEFVCPDCKSWE